MIEKVLKVLSSVDLLGFPIIFSFSGADKVRSAFGGFWSLLFIGYVIWAIYLNAYELFARENPQINQGSIYNEDGTPIAISTRTLPMAFYIRTATDAISSVQCQYQFANLQNATSIVNLNNQQIYYMEQCTQDHFGGLLDSVSESVVETYFCLPKIAQFETNYGFVVFATCPEQTGLADFLDSTPVATLLYPKFGLTLQNFRQPVQVYLGSQQVLLANQTIITSMDINHISITSDVGVITSNERTANLLKVTADSGQQSGTTGTVRVMYQFLNDKEELFYIRSYTKLQNVLANVGGMTSTLFALLVIFVAPYARVKFCEAFVNEMYQPSTEKKDENKDTPKGLKSPKKSPTRVGPIRENISEKLESPKRNSNETGNTLEMEMAKLKSGSVSPGKTQNNDTLCKSPADCHDDSSMSPLVSDTKAYAQTEQAVQARDTLFPQVSAPESVKENDLDYEEGFNPVRTMTLGDRKGRFEIDNPFTGYYSKNVNAMTVIQGGGAHNDLNLEKPEIEIKQEAQQEKDFGKVKNEDDSDPDGIVLENLSKKATLEKDECVKENQNCQEHNDLENPVIPSVDAVNEVKEGYRLEEEGSPDQIDDKKDTDAVGIDNKTKTTTKKGKKPKKSKVVNISYFEYLSSFVSKSETIKGKMAIINAGFETLENRLDVFNLLKKLRDIDKIKSLILDSDQQFLFDRLPRPEILNRENNWFQEEYLSYYDIFKDSNELDELNMKAEIIASRRRIQDKPQKSEVDEKILRLI